MQQMEQSNMEPVLSGMPVKDTIKVADKEGYASHTPDRSYLWMVQTPQAFSYDLVYGAYEKLFREQEFTGVTDDAMVVERRDQSEGEVDTWQL